MSLLHYGVIMTSLPVEAPSGGEHYQRKEMPVCLSYTKGKKLSTFYTGLIAIRKRSTFLYTLYVIFILSRVCVLLLQPQEQLATTTKT